MALSTIDNTGLSQSQILSAINMPTGSVVQVVNSSYYTYASTSSTSFLATGITASITPQFSTSKILVLVNINGVVATVGSVNETALYRNGSVISYIDNIAGYTSGSQEIQDQNPGLNYLDSPSTTSATTYTVYWKVAGSAGTIYINNYYTANGFTSSTITLMEIR